MYNFSLIILLLFLIIISFFNLIKCTEILVDPDFGVSTLDIIKFRGYRSEKHFITTEDGYIIALHRIINPLISGYKKPILLQHGLLGNSINFILNSPGGGLKLLLNQDPLTKKIKPKLKIGNNIGFVLSDLGYDVWLSNSRGNQYSTNHTRLDPFKDKLFWEFSFVEMGLFDLPACVKYITKITKSDHVGYVGFSQGTTMLLILLAEKPEYSKVIKPIILLAPVIDMQFLRGTFGEIFRNKLLMENFAKIGGPFLEQGKVLRAGKKFICGIKTQVVCENMLQSLSGSDYVQINSTRSPIYFYNGLQGASMQNIVHFHQTYAQKHLSFYDYGEKKNLIKYGSKIPPKIRWHRINSSYISIIYGTNDFLASIENIHIIKKLLPVPLFKDFKIPFELWGHFDAIYSKQAGQYVNSIIIDILAEFQLKEYPSSILI